MSFQVQHLPQDRDATGDEQWGYTFWEFITGNMLYLLAILLILGIFLFARYYSKRKRK
ncbi:MAG TPA: hypothetical protein VK941_00030 [Gillisia sp.]|nr:hypothetical protein [Gillisia sp.]